MPKLLTQGVSLEPKNGRQLIGIVAGFKSERWPVIDRNAGRLQLGIRRKPDIFNTDQGSQFTSVDFTAVLKKAEIAISMDGKGAWRDNVFVERLWRSIKYEEVYLHAYKTVSEARVGIGRYLTFYNTRRPHSSLDRQTPDQAYFNALTPMMAAA